MDLDASFASAQTRVKTLTKPPSNDKLLELYALYKQGTTGDATGGRPGMFDMVGRAKFDAWTSKKGLTKESAKQAYVTLVDQLVGG